MEEKLIKKNTDIQKLPDDKRNVVMELLNSFIDIAHKIADILEVSKYEQQDRNHIFSVIDAFIAKRKIQSII